MPSTYTASLRFEMQGTGENLNAWGSRLNTALSRIDKAIAGRTPVTLAGVNYTLSTANASDDEARSMTLDLSGVGGCDLVIPSVPKVYLVRNGSDGPVDITTGAGAAVTLAVDDVALVVCDGSEVTSLMIGGMTLKGYVDAQAWAVSNAVLPGQAGSAGGFLKTNGTTPTWVRPAVADITDYASDQAAKKAETLAEALAAATGVAAAMAVALR